MLRIFSRNLVTQYFKLSAKERLNFIPPNPPPLADFLKTIGRDAPTVTVFQDIQQLLSMEASKMNKLGLKPRIRKYILSCREWYKRTGTVPNAEMPKRQHKYLQRKEMVKTLRLKKLGLA